MNKPELLAPAGSFETLHAAFANGADAVYLGIGTTNLRAYSENFSIQDLPEILSIAKGFDGKVYLVLNTMPNDEQLDDIKKLLNDMNEIKTYPNAMIVSDPGVINLCIEIVPNVELHLSTQTGTFNIESMKFWQKFGKITRVVTPREFTLDQIKNAVERDIVEVEVFVHGAMCVSISGRCLMGSYVSGRNPNHGECSQPCRYKYDVIPKDGKGNPLPDKALSIEEDGEFSYIFNSKDLNALELIPEIIETGAHSLKIEGRNKSVHYVSVVIKAYRDAIDRYFDNTKDNETPQTYLDELENLDHRPYTNGFYGDDNKMQSVSYAKEKSKIRVVGIVKETLEGGVPVVDVKNPFSKDETLSILPINKKIEPYNLVVSSVEDLSGNILERAITNRVVIMRNSDDIKLRVGDMIRRVDNNLG